MRPISTGSIEFFSLKRANNKQFVATIFVDNGPEDLVWLTDDEARLIHAAQKAARNEVRRTVKQALAIE